MINRTHKLLLTLGVFSAMTPGSVYSGTAPSQIEIQGIEFNDLQNNIKGVISADGSFVKPVISEDEKKFTEKYTEQVRRINEPTYGERSYDLTKAAAISAAKVTFEATKYAADTAFRLSTAYFASYYGEELAVEGISKAAGGLATLMAGAPAGVVVEHGVKALYKFTKFVPGLDGVAAVALTPSMKTFVTDPLITYGPSLTKAVANKGYNALASAWNWWSGKSK